MKKRNILSVLVVIITVMTLVIMIDMNVKVDEIGNTYEVNTQVDEEKNIQEYDGTGYIFDDFNKNINIPLDKADDKGTSKKSSDAGSEIYKKRLNIVRSLEEQFMFNEDFNASRSNYSYYDVIKGSEIQNSKIAANTIENNMTFEDKASLLKLTRYIKLEDVNKIKRAISNGATKEEGQALFNLLKERLPNEDYDKLIQIINKYEREVSYKR